MTPQAVDDFLFLIQHGCTFRVYRRFGLEISLLVTRPSRPGIVMRLDLREPEKSFAGLLRQVRQLFFVLP